MVRLLRGNRSPRQRLRDGRVGDCFWPQPHCSMGPYAVRHVLPAVQQDVARRITERRGKALVSGS
jgi:hypothetical protein